MKTIRYFFLMVFVLAPGLALAQTTADTLNVVVDGGDTFGANGAAFGTAFDPVNDVGPATIVQADPYVACRPTAEDPTVFEPFLENPEEMEGNIALISRGSCAFVLKVQAAAEAGALAAIVANCDPSLETCTAADGDAIILMGGTCTTDVCTIPAAGVSFNTGQALVTEAQFESDVTIVPIDVAPVAPASTVGIHETGVLTMSVYDYGYLGANANAGQEGNGTAFEFIAGEDTTFGGLYVSSLLVGVNGVVNSNPYAGGFLEFVNVTDVTAITPPFPAPYADYDQGFVATYTSSELGLLVTQRTYSQDGGAFVIADFEVQNTSGGDIADAYIGIFADWDAAGTTSVDDAAGFNEDLNLLYVYEPVEPGVPYYGIAPVGDTNLSGYSADATAADDAQLWDALTMTVEIGADAAERAAVVGSGPYDIAAGASATARFAYVAGATEQELFDNVPMLEVAVEETTPEGTYVLKSAYPNPLASRATIGFELPTAQDVRVTVYDVLGREVAVLVDGMRQAGPQTVELDASSLPSGMYVYRLSAGSTQLTQTFTVVR